MQKNHLHRFFLSYGKNHYQEDVPLQQVLDYFQVSADIQTQLLQLGEYTGGEFLEILDYIDKVSLPKLHMWDVLGQRIDWVQIGFGHRKILEDLITSGVVYKTFVENLPWHFHYAAGYLVADPGIYCTITLTNQTAYALFKYGSNETRQKFLPFYLARSGKDAWYGATFYTEIQGGSDLGANTATARKVDDKWFIDAENKYFSSNAGIADGALVTARPEGNPPGAKGLALFFVPALRNDGNLNYTIRRLKNKFGTRAVPTGEVEMKNSEAYLIGSAETGIYESLEVLTLARLGNTVGALGIARKAYLEAYYYAQKRSAFGKPLIEHPLIQKDLLEMETAQEANLILGFKAIDWFNKSWTVHPPYNEDYYYARLLAHIVKNTSAEMSAFVTKLAMEIFGGIGFMEDFPIARWHREALVTPIWEGGSNIQALDMLEVILKKKAHLRLFSEMKDLLNALPDKEKKEKLLGEIASLESFIADLMEKPTQEIQFLAKELLLNMGTVVMAILLLDVARFCVDKLGDHRFQKIAEFYYGRHILKKPATPSEIETALPVIHPHLKIEK